MTVRGKNENDMPDVPDPDFIGTLCEIWFAINYAAYHLAYVRVYLQTEALQTHGNEIRQAEQAYKDMTQSVSEREPLVMTRALVRTAPMIAVARK
jgi:hypothetical protein